MTPNDLEYLVRYRRFLLRAGRSEATLEQRIGDLRRLRRRCGDLLHITKADLRRYIEEETTEWSPAYRKKVYISYRLFFSWAKKRGLIEKNPAKWLPTVVVPRYLPQPVPEDVVLEAFEETSLVETAMLCLGGVCGLRRSEIASAHPKKREGRQLRVFGKGGKERVVPLDGMTYSVLCQIESEQGRDDYYFRGRFGGHIHPHTVYIWLKRHLGTDWSTHNLRHRAASNGLLLTKDLRGVQELLGHQSLTTTQVYTFIGVESLQAIVDANSVQDKLVQRRLQQLLLKTGNAQAPLDTNDEVMNALTVLSNFLDAQRADRVE